MYPHRIRLRGPWRCQPLAWHGEDNSRPLPPGCTLTLPCPWSAGGLAGFRGRARLTRRFGYPGRIDAHERVWLTCEGLSDRALVRLNGQDLGACRGGFAFEVTALLRPRNELVLEVEGADEQAGVWGEVALEVRCQAYLRGVRAWRSPAGEVHVEGEVIGEAEGPLELYAVLGRHPVAYTTVTARPEGTLFHLSTADRPAEEEPRRLKIDLVKGAMVWYTWEQPLPLALRDNPER
jgi:hypothetical protein